MKNKKKDMEQPTQMSSDNSNPVQSDTTIISIIGFLCDSLQIVITHVLEAVRFLTSTTSIASVRCKCLHSGEVLSFLGFLSFLLSFLFFLFIYFFLCDGPEMIRPIYTEAMSRDSLSCMNDL